MFNALFIVNHKMAFHTRETFIPNHIHEDFDLIEEKLSDNTICIKFKLIKSKVIDVRLNCNGALLNNKKRHFVGLSPAIISGQTLAERIFHMIPRGTPI